MKYLIFFLFLAPLKSLCQDIPIVDEKIIYEKIYDYPNASKEAIYGAAKRFIGIYFKSAKSVIQSEDITTGLIICKGNISSSETYDNNWWYGSKSVGGTFHFTMQFDVKNEKARFRIFDIHTDDASSYSSYGSSLEDIVFKLAKEVNKSKGKTKDKKLQKYKVNAGLLHTTFYGVMEVANNSIKESVTDTW